jgi:hypothetical protein
MYTDNRGKSQILKKTGLSIIKMARPLFPKRTSLKLIKYMLSFDFDSELENNFKMLNVYNLIGLILKN